MTKKISKKEIQDVLHDAINTALTKLEISAPSKKTMKLLDRISKKISVRVKREIKRKANHAAKTISVKKTKAAKVAHA
jgi:RNase P subunit RPR2